MTKGTKKVSREQAEDARIDELTKPFTRPEGARRPSKAEIEAREAYEANQRELARDLIRHNDMLEAINFDLKQGRDTAEQKLAAADKEIETLRQELEAAQGRLVAADREIERSHAAAEIQADLSCMMPGELRPTIVSEPMPNEVIDSYEFRNEHGRFRVNFSKTDVKLEVIPRDTSRRPRTINVTYLGIPDESVERLIGILGLPADTPLPAVARRSLRQHHHDIEHDARMVGLLRHIQDSAPAGKGETLVLVEELFVADDEAVEAFRGHHSHTDNPAR